MRKGDTDFFVFQLNVLLDGLRANSQKHASDCTTRTKLGRVLELRARKMAQI